MNQIVGVSMLGAVRCPGSVCLLLVISAVENLTVPASAGPFGPVCLCECLCTVRKYFFFLLKCDNVFFMTSILNSTVIQKIKCY